MRTTLSLIILIATLATAGRAADEFVYVHDGGSVKVFGWRINASGMLTPVPGSPFDGPSEDSAFCGGSCQSMATGTLGKQRFLFTADLGGVTAWSLSPNGSLTVVPGSPFSDGLGDVEFGSVAAVRLGSKLLVYATATDEDRLVGFQVQPSGALLSAPGSPYVTEGGPLGIEATRRLLVVPMFFDNLVRSFAIQKDGSLVEAPTSPVTSPSTDPFTIQLDRKGKFAYMTSTLDPSVVDVLAIQKSTGEMTPVPGSPFAVGATGATSGNGTQLLRKRTLLAFANGGGAGGASISVSTQSKSGALSLIGRHVPGPGALAAHGVNAKGRLLLVVSDDESDDNILSFRMDPKTGMSIRADSAQVPMVFANDVTFVRL